jgi:hypothetical protein
VGTQWFQARERKRHGITLGIEIAVAIRVVHCEQLSALFASSL